MGPDLTGRAEHRLLCGRLAGLLFSVGSLASIPVNQLFDPAVGARTHWITALGIVSGLVCLAIPWNRLSPLWLHGIPFVASLEVGITMWGVGQHAAAYQWFLVLIVVYWAFAFEHRWEVSLHLGVVTAVALYPIARVPDELRANVVGQTVVAIPILMVAAGVVVYLRERLAATAAALAEEARRDPLTGLWNRRLLEDCLNYEVTRHRRNGRPLSVIVLDLDHFKAVNDTLGHPVGDELLRQVADAILATVRDQDTVARQGGDEFCVVAPETDTVEGAVLVGRIKAALGELVVNGVPVSASAGVATFPGDASSAELLLAQADAEQRSDKQAGRAQRAGLSVVR